MTEIDGVLGRGLVFVLAATNRPDIIDTAMLRPGRLDKMLYVPFPDLQERKDILTTNLKSVPKEEGLDQELN